MKKMERPRLVPLEERLQLARGAHAFPVAIGLYDMNFFDAIGRITGDEEKYDQVYKSHVQEYGSKDQERKDVIDLVIQAEELVDEAQEQLLYWTLVEPFAAIKKAQEQQKERKE